MIADWRRGATALAESDIDWTGVNADLTTTILREGETFLDAQLRVAVASDQRAITCANLFLTLAGVLVVATVTYFGVEKDSSAVWPIGVGVAFLVVGALACLQAARPVKFHFPGSHPRVWWDLIKEPNTHELLGAQSENIQADIDENEQVLKANANWLLWGVRIAVLAPIAMLVTWRL